MIEKPKQYYDTRRYQLYYQWPQSEYYIHQEPVYDHTREYIEALEAENAKLREYVTRLEQANIVLDSDNCDLRNDMKDMQFFIAENRKLRKLVQYIYDECYGDDWFAEQAAELGFEPNY